MKTQNTQIKPAWRNWILLITGGLFIGLVSIAAPFFAPVALLFFLVPVYMRISRSYSVNGDKIESREGLVSRRVNTIRIRDLKNVNMNQGIFQRIMNTGDLEFSSSGGAGVEVCFKGVSRPARLKQQVEHMQTREN